MTNNMFGEMFGNMFGNLAPGMCRLTMDGQVAVKTGNEYRTYDVSTGRLTNCMNFVFDVGQEFFFVIPVTKVKPGDIILVNGADGKPAPRCVVETGKDQITVVNYQNSTKEILLPEHRIFMGSTYMYGKIVSLFGGKMFRGGKGGNKMLQYMLMMKMFGGGNAGFGGMNNNIMNGNGMNGILPLMLMANTGMDNLFGGMFEDDEDEEEDAE